MCECAAIERVTDSAAQPRSLKERSLGIEGETTEGQRRFQRVPRPLRLARARERPELPVIRAARLEGRAKQVAEVQVKVVVSSLLDLTDGTERVHSEGETELLEEVRPPARVQGIASEDELLIADVTGNEVRAGRRDRST